MTETEKRVPELRFEGFVEDWEQRKLGELASFSKGTGYTKGDLKAIGKPIILYGRLYTKYETVIENVDTFVDEKEKSVISAGNEVIVPASGETSEDISRASVVAKPGIILGGDLNIVKPNTEINPSFLALTISNGRQQKELSKKAQGKSVVHLHNSDLKEVNLVYPQKEEQSKIGNFFKHLDDTIALHLCKQHQLEALKQSLIKDILPQNDSVIPRLRFAGFSDSWEQRKLGDLAESFEYGLNASATIYDGENKYIRITDIDESSHLFLQKNLTSPDTDLSNANNYLLETGDLLFARTGASVGKSYQYNISDGKVYFAGFLIRARIRPEVNSNFIFQNTFTSNYQNFIKITSQRSGQPGVNAQEYATFDLVIPSKKEQDQLGSYFEQLDKTIKLQQCKLEKLIELKHVLLGKMFL